MTEAAVTAITSGVDFATIITGVGAIGAAVMGVLVAIKGTKMLFSLVR